MSKYVCDVCGYIYDPELGDPDNGIEPGTAFEALGRSSGRFCLPDLRRRQGSVLCNGVRVYSVTEWRLQLNCRRHFL